MELTDEQKLILENSDGNIYISASPGSGKSTMLSHITSRLLDLSSSNYVMLVTFTNKASKSIIDKCANVDQQRIMGGTFHGITYKLLKRNGFERYICDESKKRLIIKKIFGCRADKDKFEKLYECISRLKSRYPLPSDHEVLNRYQAELDKYKLIDFDDIIINGIESLPQVTYGVPSITHILVDELQDTSGPQLELLKGLHKKTGATMIGVADDDQSIYAWRGARPENVRDFIDTFSCTVYNMGYNFRSGRRIVDKSRLLIEHNSDRIPKKIRAFKDHEGVVSEYKCMNPWEEIDYAIMRCKQFKDTEIAILYRNRTFKNHLEFELRKANLDYTVNDFLEITDRSAIKVMLSTLKICAKEFDLYDLQNAAKAIKGFGIGTVTKLEKDASEGLPITRVFHFHSENKKQKARLKSLLELQKYFKEHEHESLENMVREVEKYFTKSFDYAEEMREFLIDISRDYKINAVAIKRLNNELGLNGKEEHNTEGAKIELSTVHGYKGCEKEIVVLPWCQQYTEVKSEQTFNEEAERRLFYVAATRAKDKLYMSYTGPKPKFIKEMKA